MNFRALEYVYPYAERYKLIQPVALAYSQLAVIREQNALQSEKLLVDICQTQSEKQFPRKSICRDEKSKTAQMSFLYPEQEIGGQLYCVITHGGPIDGIEPRFICVGRPNMFNKAWEECENILAIRPMHAIKASKEEEDLALTFTSKALEEMTGEGVSNGGGKTK